MVTAAALFGAVAPVAYAANPGGKHLRVEEHDDD